ncbi:3-oxoacyl-[acyl-carrier protein] reductase [Paenibacillus sp. UNCCL117]|uniref:SDR family NAD(P)-dependent oxidoreductase n=1 Tax=unclassified Paenibacillus TaxID=185978 RepID=UPI00088B65EC|nr:MULTISPECIES: SDR family oxidoreductase [unclassified Paenibacillus]SDC96524.1 3-oxoacyl-[acyl-carrier protein] reductase [Paenibacillus sp. cl123]SFW30321.1 3-oxoacyl-[acyl-carrier protein] reductase [Paenibacillus sp. UNCCL117]
MNGKQLEDKVIWITGALGMLGQSAVSMFLERGARIAACDLLAEESVPEVAAWRRTYGDDRLQYLQADMTRESDVQKAVASVLGWCGKLDGAYHNVYVNKAWSIANQTLDDWEDTVRGTLTSAFLVCKHAALAMLPAGYGGTIVLTSSILGNVPAANNGAYGAAKAGVEQLVRIAALEYAAHGIRVNALVPGDFKSVAVRAAASEASKETIRKATLIGRSGYPGEVNETAAFLLSDAASYVTGSRYLVTGGFELCR